MPRRHKLKISNRIWGTDPGPFEGNDVRMSGGVLGRCILCGTRTQLRLSHVIPRWAFQWHRDAWGGKVKTLLLSRGVELVQQDGNKHYLMCESCEQLASESEAYACDLTKQDNTKLKARGTRHLFGDRFWNLRVDLIARFVAITALRIHFAPSVPMANTALPKDIRKTLRKVAFFGHRDLDVIVAAWRFIPPKSNPEHDPREDLFEMYENGALGRVFIMLVGGIEWMLCFDSSHVREKIGEIGLTGRWIERIVRLPYDEYRLFKHSEKWAPRIRKKMDVAKQTTEQPCPPASGDPSLIKDDDDR